MVNVELLSRRQPADWYSARAGDIIDGGGQRQAHRAERSPVICGSPRRFAPDVLSCRWPAATNRSLTMKLQCASATDENAG